MNYAVIGIGHFGFHVAKGLAERGINVAVADISEDKIREMSHIIEYAYVLDSTDVAALKEAGIVDFDVVFVSLGNDIESSILTVMALKSLNNKTIIAKAKNAVHGEILAKIGATKIVYPEREMARKLVKYISKKVFLDVVDISDTFKGLKFSAPKFMIGENAGKINFDKWNVKLIAIKKEEKWIMAIEDNTIEEKDTIFCVGAKKDIEKYISEVLE